METALDIAFIAYDIYDISANGLNWESGLSLAADVVGAALPLVTGGGAAVRAIMHADDVIDAAKVVDAVDDIVDAANAADDIVDAANAGDNLADIANVADDLPCPLNSFRADTDVVKLTGESDIAAIEIGDYVLAWNEANNTLGYYPVTATIHHTDLVLIELIINGEWIETTSEHPFYVEKIGWTNAENLQTGMLVQRADGSTGMVWFKWKVYHQQEMYNLTVATAHTFFVGDGRWLVHNCGAPTKPGQQFNPDQDALIELAKDAENRGGVSGNDAQTLLDWANEYNIQPPAHGPEIHPNRNFNIWHIHIGPVDHIPVIPK